MYFSWFYNVISRTSGDVDNVHALSLFGAKWITLDCCLYYIIMVVLL